MKNYTYLPRVFRKSYASVVNLVKMLALGCGRVFPKWGFGGSRSHKPGWRGVLKDLAVKIEDLNSSTEREFLEIGEILQGFYRSAKEISRESEAVAGLMSGERISDAIERLHTIFGRIEGMESESQQHAEALDGILQTLGGVSRSLAGFNRFIHTLEVFCTSIRVESARLGSSDIGYDTLADSVQEVMDLDPDQVEPPPRIGTRLKSKFIKGMGKRDNQFIIILDINRVFSADELAITLEVDAEMAEAS
jgi:hypothetical protein